MSRRQIIEADLTWTNVGRFERGVRIAVNEQGFIEEVGAIQVVPTLRLPNVAILPGFVNVHSHAFQRGLRGHGERFPEGKGSFWTWRQAMYRLVDSLDADSLYSLSVQAFKEMLVAGITTVGEFHYVHHDATLDGFAFDEVILRAAADTGIRLVLINTFYKTGGIMKPLAGGQLRFRTDSIVEYWKQMDRLTSRLDSATQTLAAAAHSVRAVALDDIKSLHQESVRRHLPFHMHVEEQPQEVVDCVNHYGKPPMAMLNEHLAINPMFTAVHCTHTAAADMDDYLGAGGNVCINPLTEGNLGDGIPSLGRIMKKQGHVALGSDSNLRLCWTEEMRWLEYGQRLMTQQRGLCVDEQGNVASKLLEAATSNGARCLGVRTGRIQPKHWADFVSIGLDTPALQGWTNETLLDSIVFGTGCEAITAVCVGGRWHTTKGMA